MTFAQRCLLSFLLPYLLSSCPLQRIIKPLSSNHDISSLDLPFKQLPVNLDGQRWPVHPSPDQTARSQASFHLPPHKTASATS
ncbi:hypothetical protein DL95DRAFT_397908 [Leptodontidium sp. 2 PMI_412]|nr:hypothetical protein DL95DRAFT_397908 [Leptodontidium sp. 2 PMI_412]